MTAALERRQKVFLPTSQRGLEKYVPFKKSDDFSFVVYQQVPTDEAVLQYIDTPVLKIETQNLTISVAHLIEKVGCAKGNITTGFAFRLNIITGLPEVVYGTVRCESDSTEKKSGVVDDVKGFFGFGSKSDEQKPFEEEVDDKESSTSVDEANEASTSSQRPTSSLEASADVTKHAGPKKRTETVYIKFSSTTEGTLISSTAELKRSKDRYNPLLSHLSLPADHIDSNTQIIRFRCVRQITPSKGRIVEHIGSFRISCPRFAH